MTRPMTLVVSVLCVLNVVVALVAHNWGSAGGWAVAAMYSFAFWNEISYL